MTLPRRRHCSHEGIGMFVDHPADVAAILQTARQVVVVMWTGRRIYARVVRHLTVQGCTIAPWGGGRRLRIRVPGVLRAAVVDGMRWTMVREISDRQRRGEEIE